MSIKLMSIGLNKPVLTLSFLKRIIFILLMFTYGFFSTSTPDKIGLPEIILLILLMLIFYDVPINILNSILKERLSLKKFIVITFIFYFLVFSSFYGLIINQNTIINFIRDFIPFLYFCIPIFLYREIKNYPNEWLKIIVIGMLLAGIGFIFQFYIDTKLNIFRITIQQMYGSRDNPWQDPVSIFTFSFFSSLMIYSILKRNLIHFLLSFIFYVFIFIVYASTVSRAPIMLSVFSMLLTFWLIYPYNSKSKFKARFIGILIGFIFICISLHMFQNEISKAIDLIIKKTETVGIDNARIIEIKAVINNITSLPKLLFGEGWGGLISNPIYGGAKLRYVHNMTFYFLLKTGLIGVILMIIYIIWILRPIKYFIFILKKFPYYYAIAFISLFPPLIVAGILEPMFKTLSFGVLLSAFLAYYFLIKDYKYGYVSKFKKI